ncbi:MAG TPA: dihydrolipoyl dehydrogenase [Solirubrobacteraceae bacterium]|jgi:dihydrolipoamide dehydrogenase|nr:dihydrolipoyl dehydrogenase [Solirubrobacteraceae bacterium]
MAETSYDMIVIGSGPGGYVAAIRAAQLGKKTAVVEKDKVGGRCLNYACIPAKAVLRSADLLDEIREAGDYGLDVSGVEVDYEAVQGRREKVVSTLTGGVAGLFKKNNIDVIEGEASLVRPSGGDRDASRSGNGVEGQADGDAQKDDAPRVRVGDRELTATTVILATGSVKRSIPGVEFGGGVIGTEEAWALPELPARLTVVGAGASGAEIASGFARLGSDVKLFEVMDRLLPTEDADISRLVERGLKRQGIDVHTGTPVEGVNIGEGGVRFSYGSESAEVDYLVICAGRGPDVDALGLKDAGIELDERGLVRVDGAQRTTAAGIYAIGDLVHGPALAHKASDEGIIAAEDSAGLPTHPLSYVDIPRATFCTPNVGSFGLTEEQAREQGYDVVVGKVPYGAVGGGTVYGDRTGLVKLVGESKYGELLGGHIVGSRATELIQELVNVRALEGGFAEVARIVHGHPTLSEAVMEAGRAADGWLIHG